MKTTLKKSDFLVPYDTWDDEHELVTKSTIVKGRKQTINGVVCYVHKDYFIDLYWVVSHYESGMQISKELDRRVAISEAQSIIEKHINEIESRAKSEICALGWVYPLNPLK
jgi:hypothetical protein